MKQIDDIDLLNKKIFSVSNKDLLIINQLLIEKFKKNNITVNPDSIFSELELIKKDPKNSFLYDIVKNYLIKDNIVNNKKIIIDTSIKLFDNIYKDVIKKYKNDKRKEFRIKNKKKGNKILLPFNDKIIEVPSKIGHSYTPIKILPIEDLKNKYSRHKRLKVFHNKGFKCVSCNKVGKYLIVARDKGNSIHIDLYTEDFKLMTVDHIKPKSKGGTYDLDNLDPMCSKCNSKKADKYKE